MYVWGSGCRGTEVGRGSFGEGNPRTAKGLLPPYGFDRRGLGQGTRVEEVVAGGAPPGPRVLLVQALPVLWMAWGLGSHSTDCINPAEQQGFPKASPSV